MRSGFYQSLQQLLPKLYFSGSAVAENHCALFVDFSVDHILNGERPAALRQLTRRKRQRIRTVAGNKDFCIGDAKEMWPEARWTGGALLVVGGQEGRPHDEGPQFEILVRRIS